MKIKPIQIWTLGQVKTGDTLTTYVVGDNLQDSATFYFSIGNEQEVLTQGNLSMTGEDYERFTSNEYAYDWVLNKLGLQKDDNG